MIRTDRRDRGHISSNGNSNSNSRGASRDNLVGYMEQQYDEQKETQSAVKAIERMQASEKEREKEKEDIWLDNKGIPAPKEVVPPPPGLGPANGKAVPPPPGLIVPAAQPRGGFAAALASNPSNGNGNSKEKKAKGPAKPAATISKKKKKELQSLLYG